MTGLTRRTTAMTVACAIGISLSITAVPLAANAAPQDVFYVSTTGSDTTGTGSAGSPWATIEHARDHIESSGLNDNMTGDIDVLVAAGDYYVDETIAFDEGDSGSNGFSVNYKNKDAVGSAHLIGGEEITGWTHHSGNIYKAAVDPGWEFETLIENGDRAWEARYPNKNPGAFPSSQTGYLSSEGVYGSRTVLQYKTGDLNPAGWDIDDAQVYIWSGDYWDWFTDTVPVAGIDAATRQITFEQPTRYPVNQTSFHKDGSRYFVQGVLALLDQPGEFYLDSSAGQLYYSARDGAIADQTIVAPRVKRIVSVIGASAGDRAHDITFDGLTIEGSDFTDWYRHAWVSGNDSGEGHTYSQYDRQISMPQHRTGMVYLENTRDISIVNNHLKNSGYSAVYMLFANEENLVSGNLIEHTGHAGIFLEGPYPGEGDVLRNNVLTNNVIHDVGELVGHGSGVYIMNSSGNEVSYSEIYNSPRYAVAVDAYRSIPNDKIYAHDNHLKNLRIRDTAQDSGDTGSIYMWGVSDSSVAPYNVNYLDQITIDRSWANPSVTDYPSLGLFLDNATFGQDVRNVKITNSEDPRHYRNNGSGGNTFVNVSWQTGFNEAAMDYANIGVKSTFPYPIAPSGLTASATGSQIDLAWQGVKNASSYDVLRSTSESGPFSTVVCSAVTATSCADSAVTSGVTYFYVVVARTSAGLVSAPSTSVAELYGDLASDSFENGIAIWDGAKGSKSTSTAVAHTGTKSYPVDQDVDVITYPFASAQNKVATVWFYDDKDDTSMQVFTKVDDAAWDNGSLWRGLGVQTSTSAGFYSKRVNGTVSATQVPRTDGWHKFTFDYSSGTGVVMSIDGTQVATQAGITSFTQISMGDWWSNGSSDPVYFDDITVADPPPPPAFTGDGFESGFGSWAASKGTPSTAAVAHAGAASYTMNQDSDVITHQFSSNRNGKVSVWFYDDTTKTNLQLQAKVDSGAWDSGTVWRGVGIAPAKANYVVRQNATTTETTVARSTGWHKFTFDYTSGTDVKISIDSTVVATYTGVTQFSQISLGDWWADGRTSNLHFDDVLVE